MTTARIISRVTGMPWLIQAEALQTIIEIAGRDLPDQATIDAWKNEASRHALATRAGDPLGNSPTARVRDGVAIIPIAGPIFRYANLFTEFSGATALSDFATNLAAARADGRVRSVMLEIDSPGGDVTGLAEAADMIAAVALEKPLVAYVEGSAHSAAYWLASSASRVVLSPTATIGSLGAVIAMEDRTDARARDGVRRFRFVSTQTPNKLLDPTTDAGAAKVQALADRLASEFLAAAAKARGMEVSQLLAATDGGGLVVGADAVDAGLADDVMGFEATLALLSESKLPKAGPKPVARASAEDTTAETETGPALRANIEETDMSEAAQSDAPAQPETVTVRLAVQGAEEVQASIAALAEAASADPVAAERARTAAILAAAKPGFAALSTLAITAGWPVEQFEQAQAASETAVAAARAEAAGNAFRDSLPTPAGPAAPAATSGPDKWKAEFAASEALQAEFRTEGAYVGFKQAEADGKVRTLKRPA